MSTHLGTNAPTTTQPPDISYLRARLHYDATTGSLFWRPWPGMPSWWLAKYAGREAFATVEGRGYRVGSIDGRRFYAHRVIFALVHGHWPRKVDHEDWSKGHNTPTNLRDVDDLGNARNRPKHRSNSSGVTGVCWEKNTKKWKAQIGVRGRHIRLGAFSDFGDAVAAREVAEAYYGFHKNHGRHRV